MPTIRMNTPPRVPSQGAAQVLVPKNDDGMMFWICGVPGSASMVKVKAPSAMVPGIRRLGMSLDRKSTRLNPVTNAHLVCRLLLEKKNRYQTNKINITISVKNKVQTNITKNNTHSD